MSFNQSNKSSKFNRNRRFNKKGNRGNNLNIYQPTSGGFPNGRRSVVVGSTPVHLSWNISWKDPVMRNSTSGMTNFSMPNLIKQDYRITTVILEHLVNLDRLTRYSQAIMLRLFKQRLKRRGPWSKPNLNGMTRGPKRFMRIECL